MAYSIESQLNDRPRQVPAGASAETQIKITANNMLELWEKFRNLLEMVGAHEDLLFTSTDLSMEIVLQRLKEFSVGYSHTSKMPDLAGINTDHDPRYYTKSQVNAGITDQYRLARELEEAWKFAETSYYKKLAYTGNDLTLVTIYDGPGMGTTLFTKVLTYVTGDLTQVLITRISPANTLTKTLVYAGGNLDSITVVAA